MMGSTAGGLPTVPNRDLPNVQPTTLSPTQRQEWITELLTAAQLAAEAVIRVYAQPDLGIEYKKFGEPVTRADTAASTVILAHLEKVFPSFPIICEESDPS